MESFFSTVKSELTDRFDTYGDAKMEFENGGVKLDHRAAV